MWPKRRKSPWRLTMTVKFESIREVDVLRYRGVHVCSNRDHVLDERMRTHLMKRVSGGRRRFLLDVRDLHVRYGSGLADLYNNAWEPVRGKRTRVALLWDPLEPDPWSETLDRPGMWDPDLHCLRRLGESLDAFEDEARALAFLRCDDESLVSEG